MNPLSSFKSLFSQTAIILPLSQCLCIQCGTMFSQLQEGKEKINCHSSRTTICTFCHFMFNNINTSHIPLDPCMTHTDVLQVTQLSVNSSIHISHQYWTINKTAIFQTALHAHYWSTRTTYLQYKPHIICHQTMEAQTECLHPLVLQLFREGDLVLMA